MPSKRIAIIGAGPIGLEAALYARTLGHDVVVFERATVGANIAAWGFTRFFTPWLLNATSLGRKTLGALSPPLSVPLEQYPTGLEFCQRYLAPLASAPLLRDCVREHADVVHVSKDDRPERPFRILAKDSDGKEQTEQADVLLDCSGTYGLPRWSGRAGAPAPGEIALRDRIFHTIPDVLGRDRQQFADRHALVIGCTYCSAIVLRDLQDLAANHRRTNVTWAVRRPDQTVHPILNDPLRARGRLVESMLRLLERPPGWLQFLSTAVLESLGTTKRGFSATFRSNGRVVSLMPDEVVSLNGFRPDNSIYDPPAPQQPEPDTLRSTAAAAAREIREAAPPPRFAADKAFYLLGAKNYGLNTNFLLQAGHMQIIDAFAIIEGVPELDLYQ